MVLILFDDDQFVAIVVTWWLEAECVANVNTWKVSICKEF